MKPEIKNKLVKVKFKQSKPNEPALVIDITAKNVCFEGYFAVFEADNGVIQIIPADRVDEIIVKPVYRSESLVGRRYPEDTHLEPEPYPYPDIPE